MDLKQLKQELKKKTDKDPDSYYAVELLKEKGFQRKNCSKCGKYFWSTSESDVCGDPECAGAYTFIGDPPTKKRMDFIEVWKEFSSLFKKLGYEPIKRYPTVARWRDDTYWNNASIYDFQPHVVSGEIEPPANPLVVPQTCVRFNDIDNVGITGRHYTSFVMIGQHAFMEPDKFDQNKYLADMLEWLEKGIGLQREEIKFHEDQWGGGGNLGVCMEFFARGLEIGNQVYMLYEITPGGYKELNLKVLDMGMGQERPSWLSHGTPTSYEVNFPSVVKALYKETGIKPNQELLAKFLPYSGLLNTEEVESVDNTWKYVAEKIGEDEQTLKKEVLPIAALYSIGEHSRTLLLAINDGALPSNVGGGYNLRVLFRRATGFINTYGWNLDLGNLCEMHAKYLKPQYPELLENLEEVKEILDVEKKKYNKTLAKSRQIVEKLVGKGIDESKLIELYDSQGITPEYIRDVAKDRNVDIEIPDNFYAKVAERHADEKTAEKSVKESLDLKGIAPTEKLFYEDYKLGKVDGKVLKVIDKNKIILDRSVFFPTGGGQLYDTGYLNDTKVLDTVKQGNVVIHIVEKPGLKEGDTVHEKIDLDRRFALARNHSAAHIVGGAARRVLGKHVWQAGSQIDLDKGRLDITHYENLIDDQKTKIEELSNQVVKEARTIHKSFIPRNEAEKEYGFVLYQGGAVPGKEIRVVRIEDWDVQACGGTHLDNTKEAEKIKLLKTEKIQDGVVRLVFAAGKELVDKYEDREKNILKGYTADEAKELARVFSVQPEQLPKTIERFEKELSGFKNRTNKIAEKLNASLEISESKAGSDKISVGKKLFEDWKLWKKESKRLEALLIESKVKTFLDDSVEVNNIQYVVESGENFGMLMQIATHLTNENKRAVAILFNQERVLCIAGSDSKKDASETLNTLFPNSGISGNSEKAIALVRKVKREKILEKLNRS